MGDSIQIIHIQDSSSSSQTTAASVNTTICLPVLHKHCFPALLLVLSLATSTINLLLYTSVLLQWLAFCLLLSCIFLSSALFVTLFIYFTERYFVVKNIKVFYFVYALRTSLKYFFGSSSLLLSWLVLIKPRMSIFVFHFITSTVATFVIATGMWMLKIVILKALDCRFHDKNFFEKLQVLISNEYVLQTLLGFFRVFKKSEDNNTRARFKWIKRASINLMNTGLHTICDEVGKSNLDHDHEVENVISLVLKNITNNEIRDIQEPDLLLVMEKEVILDFLRLFDGATETKRISQESLRNYMIKVCNERENLVKLLCSSSKVIVQLSKNASVIQAFVVALVWVLLMGIETTKSLVYSPLLLLLGYYCKIIFDGAMLAIVTHPFDLGDHCIIDDEQLVVEDIGLINTTFLKENGTKLKLQNSVLQTKFISNLNRSTELTDTFVILVSSTTSSDKIEALRLKIDELITSKPENWRALYCFNDIGVDDEKHMYNLEITDARQFQNYKVKRDRRSELILKLTHFLRDLDFKNVTIK